MFHSSKKRKHEYKDGNCCEPKSKRQKLNSHQKESNLHSPATQYTANNILNDNDLFLNDEDPSHSISSSESNSHSCSDSQPESEYTPNTNNKYIYKTPTTNRTLFNRTLSPLMISGALSTNEDQDIDAITASIYRISENSLSILFQFLQFNDILQMSKTCGAFWMQSFKLLTHLTTCCKTIYGVNTKQVNRLISRCSFYLKSLDLSRTASIVNDATISVISKHCQQLTVVSLHGCKNITDETMILFLKQCLWIRELDLSGCSQLTSDIGEALALSPNLTSLNLAWCTEINCNIIPYLIYLNENHSLMHVNLHCINKFITVYPAFKYVFDAMSTTCGGTEFKLKHKLFIIGGLQQKTMNEENLIQHISYLAAKGIEYKNPETLHLRSISEYDFKYKLNLLLNSEHLSSEAASKSKIIGKRTGYRLYTASNTDKIYMVLVTTNGVFGTKLLPDKDFTVARDEYMAALQHSDRDPIEYLKKDLDLDYWDWCEEFQSKRSLSLLGMNRNANWIKLTTLKYCRKINAFVNAQQPK